MTSLDQPFFTSHELAELFGVTPGTVRSWINRELIYPEAEKRLMENGKRITVFSRSAVQHFAQERWGEKP